MATRWCERCDNLVAENEKCRCRRYQVRIAGSAPALPVHRWARTPTDAATEFAEDMNLEAGTIVLVRDPQARHTGRYEIARDEKPLLWSAKRRGKARFV